MATKRGFRRSVQVQDTKVETTYGSDIDGTYTLHKVDSDPFQLTSELVDDTDLISNVEEATSLVELSRSTSGSLNFPRVKPHSLAMVAAYAMSGGSGVPADTTSGNLGNGDYRHVITPQTSAFELSSCTIYDELDADTLGYKYPGMMCTDFSLTADRKSWFALSSNWIGSGARTAVLSDHPNTSEISGEPPLKAGDATVYLATAAAGETAAGLDPRAQTTEDLTGSAVSGFNSKVISLNWSFNNNIGEDTLYDFNSGLLKARAERVRRTQTLSMTVEFADAVELNYLTALTTLSAEINCVSATQINSGFYYGFDLLFPQMQLLSANVGGGTDQMTVDMEFQIFQNSTDGSVELDVYNHRSSQYAHTA